MMPAILCREAEIFCAVEDMQDPGKYRGSYAGGSGNRGLNNLDQTRALLLKILQEDRNADADMRHSRLPGRVLP
jgi:hypothetical protein